ncbi:hypothetical protein KIPB_016824, partial [Kipferlia bialata]
THKDQWNAELCTAFVEHGGLTGLSSVLERLVIGANFDPASVELTDIMSSFLQQTMVNVSPDDAERLWPQMDQFVSTL